ncbi:hypothetical protein E4U31_004527 [Claviceps sp. LM219 group G6]|nr:hypothetical protein E4U31_004527 [Claviceps sp. LM219 group G6]
MTGHRSFGDALSPTSCLGFVQTLVHQTPGDTPALVGRVNAAQVDHHDGGRRSLCSFPRHLYARMVEWHGEVTQVLSAWLHLPGRAAQCAQLSCGNAPSAPLHGPLTTTDVRWLYRLHSRHNKHHGLCSASLVSCDGPTLLRTSAFSSAPRLELSSKEYDSHPELICPDSVVALPPEFFAHWIDGLFDVLGLADEFDANVEDAPRVSY